MRIRTALTALLLGSPATAMKPATKRALGTVGALGLGSPKAKAQRSAKKVKVEVEVQAVSAASGDLGKVLPDMISTLGSPKAKAGARARKVKVEGVPAVSAVCALSPDLVPAGANSKEELECNLKEQEEQEGCILFLEDLVEATFLRRPSQHNKSAYVGDILVEGREAIAHLPSMDMGGKMVPGVRCLVKPARDRKGVSVSPEAKGKFGTPKCEYIMQLIRNDEPENYPGCWVGAHPRLGEDIVKALLGRGLLQGDLGPCLSFRREVLNIAGTDMRSDFLVCNAVDGEGRPTAQTIVEVKVVVDTDYDPAGQGQGMGQVMGQGQEQVGGMEGADVGGAGDTEGPEEVEAVGAVGGIGAEFAGEGAVAEVGDVGVGAVGSSAEGDAGDVGAVGAVGVVRKRAAKGKCVFYGPPDVPYQRAGIFPWGKSSQKGPEGEKVVSARAIRHVMELTSIAKGEKTDAYALSAAVIFVVIRQDALLFRPNQEACPSFAKYLREAQAGGVKLLAYSIGWGEEGEGGDLGKAIFRGKLPIDLTEHQTVDKVEKRKKSKKNVDKLL